MEILKAKSLIHKDDQAPVTEIEDKKKIIAEYIEELSEEYDKFLLNIC